jgi:hypothetical protein
MYNYLSSCWLVRKHLLESFWILIIIIMHFRIFKTGATKVYAVILLRECYAPRYRFIQNTPSWFRWLVTILLFADDTRIDDVCWSHQRSNVSWIYLTTKFCIVHKSSISNWEKLLRNVYRYLPLFIRSGTTFHVWYLPCYLNELIIWYLPWIN